MIIVYNEIMIYDCRIQRNYDLWLSYTTKLWFMIVVYNEIMIYYCRIRQSADVNFYENFDRRLLWLQTSSGKNYGHAGRPVKVSVHTLKFLFRLA
jgi:hypothetical protein